MGKKIIVVGDDEQASPLSVGLDEAKMQNLMNMLIKDKIPNAHLWDAKTSLYDIAAQVYPTADASGALSLCAGHHRLQQSALLQRKNQAFT